MQTSKRRTVTCTLLACLALALAPVGCSQPEPEAKPAKKAARDGGAVAKKKKKKKEPEVAVRTASRPLPESTALVLAVEGVKIGPRSVVGGAIEVVPDHERPRNAPKPTLALADDAVVTGMVAAPEIRVGERATLLGTARFERMSGEGRAFGPISLMKDVPPVPRPPRTLDKPASGDKDVALKANETKTLPAGGYGRVLMPDRAKVPAVLRLEGERHSFVEIESVGPLRIECAAPECNVTIKKRLLLGAHGYIGAVEGSPGKITIHVMGDDPDRKASAVQIGAESTLQGAVLAHAGTLNVAARSFVYGQLGGRRIALANDVIVRDPALAAPGHSASMGLYETIPFPGKIPGEYEEGRAKQRLLVAWTPGTSWDAMSSLVHTVQGRIGGVLPARGLTSVELDAGPRVPRPGAERDEAELLKAAYEALDASPLVQAIGYDTWGGPLAAIEPAPAIKGLLAIDPPKPAEGDAVSLQVMDAIDPGCDVAAYVMPKREGERVSMIYVETADTSELCRIDAPPAKPAAGASARATAIPLGPLTAGRYSVQIGTSKLEFDVKPGANRTAAAPAAAAGEATAAATP